MNSNHIQNLAEKMMALATKESDACEVGAGTGWSSEVVFEENKLKRISSHQSAGLDLRIINKGRIGVAATNQMEAGEVKKVVDEALEVSKFGKNANFQLPGPQKYKKVKLFDSKVEQVTEKDLAETGEQIMAKIRVKEPEIRINNLIFGKSVRESLFLNSAGASQTEKASDLSFGLEVSQIQEGDFFQLGTGQESRRADINYEVLVDDLLEKVGWGKRIDKIPSGKRTVIFAPEAADAIINYLLTGLNGKAVNEGVSKLAGSIGKQMFNQELILTDDPTVDFGVESYGLDDEGVPGVKKSLIDRGIVKGFYYDLAEAAKAGVEPTGNGARGPFSQAQPQPGNIFVAPGSKSYKELLANIDSGLIVYQLLGVGQNNPYNGDFQLGVNLGYKISHGEIIGRVKDVGIAGNVFDLLKNRLSGLSREVERWGSLTTPYWFLDGVTVESG